ncbi:MAG: PTS sugar transporter subunit IIA [Peptostreptococcus sp.]|uniref:PTS sugar transporter subunit IIA n=1 Tax=Peptostreptococcus sp. TaxID=1262 RepID=UPI002FCAF103
MISIIISGHGNFASGLYSAMKLISGEFENVSFFDFVEGKTSDDMDSFYNETIKNYKSDVQDIVILADLAGGTPFNRAVTMSLIDEKIKVVSGTNLPMLVTAVMSRDLYSHDNIDEFVENLLLEGKGGIETFKLKEKTKQEDIEEGI